MTHRLSMLFSLSASLLLSGCGGDGDQAVEEYEVYPVTGTVRVDGKPMSGVSVVFSPAGADTKGDAAYGTTNESGEYTLATRDGREGAAAGKYYILVSRMQLPDGSPLGKDQMAADAGAVNGIAERYSNPETSGLFAQVNAGENSPIDIDVKAAKR